jgi:hypothetical protein
MAKENTPGLTAESIKDNGKTVKSTATENILGRMENFTRVAITRTRNKALVSTDGPMAKCMRGIGCKVSNMERER